MPLADWLGQGRTLALHQLFGGPAEQFWDSEVEMLSESLHLLVERVRELDFGAFHKRKVNDWGASAQAASWAGSAFKALLVGLSTKCTSMDVIADTEGSLKRRTGRRV
jgi:hypothetical protein